MIPLVATIAIVGAAVLIRSVCNIVRDRTVERQEELRENILTRRDKALESLEYERRGVLLDLLHGQIVDATEELEILEKQIEEVRYSLRSAAKNKVIKSTPLSRLHRSQLFEYYHALLALKQYYWCIRRKCSQKKHDIATSDLSIRKRVTQSFFDFPSWSEYVESIPVRSAVVRSTVKDIKSDSIVLQCNNPISYGSRHFLCKLPKDQYPRSTSRWLIGNEYDTLVSSVDYPQMEYNVDIPSTLLIRRIKEEGLENIIVKGEPIQKLKNDIVVGYAITERGVSFFLPVSLAGRDIQRVNEIEAHILSEGFDPLNPVISMGKK